MDATGSSREGWMTFVPITVFVFIVIYVLGGPEHVMNLMLQWTLDIVASVISWVKHL